MGTGSIRRRREINATWCNRDSAPNGLALSDRELPLSKPTTSTSSAWLDTGHMRARGYMECRHLACSKLSRLCAVYIQPDVTARAIKPTVTRNHHLRSGASLQSIKARGWHRICLIGRNWRGLAPGQNKQRHQADQLVHGSLLSDRGRVTWGLHGEVVNLGTDILYALQHSYAVLLKEHHCVTTYKDRSMHKVLLVVRSVHEGIIGCGYSRELELPFVPFAGLQFEQGSSTKLWENTLKYQPRPAIERVIYDLDEGRFVCLFTIEGELSNSFWHFIKPDAVANSYELSFFER